MCEVRKPSVRSDTLVQIRSFLNISLKFALGSFRRRLRVIALLSLPFFLGACGGGGGGGSEPPPAKPTASQVSISSETPPATKDKITELVGFTSSATGSTGQIKTNEGTSIVLAYDENGALRMGGTVSGESPITLDAGSTSVALVRLAITAKDDLTEKQLETLIRATASFPTLVSAVDKALQAGLLVSNDDAVITNLIQVINEVSESAGLLSATEADAKAKASDASVSSPPFDLIKAGLGSVTIESDLEIKNSTPIAWDVISKTYGGGPVDSGLTRLPAAGFWNRVGSGLSNWGLLGLALDYFLSNRTVVPGDNGKTFKLVLQQTQQTRIANSTKLYLDLFLELAKEAAIGASDECKAAVINAITSSQKLSELASKDVPDSFLASFKSLSREALDGAMSSNVEIAQKCSVAAREALKQLPKIVGARVVLIYRIYEITTKVVNYASLAERLYVLTKYWSTDIPYTVCMGKAVFGPRVTNCTNKLKLIPESLVFTPGGEADIETQAFDSPTSRTLIPTSLNYSPSSGNILLWRENKLVALGQGSENVSVSDAITSVSSDPLKIFVVPPRFNKTKLDVNVNETKTLTLQDPQGNRITHNGDTQWGVVPKGIVAVLPNGLNFESLGNISKAVNIHFQGLSPGKATVVGHNLTDGSFTEVLEVTVDGAFAFETVEIEPRSAGRTEICSPLARQLLEYSLAGEECISTKDARIRCVGPGCVGGRFYVSIRTSKLSIYVKCYTGPCESQVYTQDDYGIVPVHPSTYEPDSIWWYAMGDGGWVKAWPSVSAINNNTYYYKISALTNFLNYPLLLGDGGKLDLEYIIYDKLKNTYLTKTLTVTAP